jgi:hypothetical protein
MWSWLDDFTDCRLCDTPHNLRTVQESESVIPGQCLNVSHAADALRTEEEDHEIVRAAMTKPCLTWEVHV